MHIVSSFRLPASLQDEKPLKDKINIYNAAGQPWKIMAYWSRPAFGLVKRASRDEWADESEKKDTQDTGLHSVQ